MNSIVVVERIVAHKGIGTFITETIDHEYIVFIIESILKFDRHSYEVRLS